MFELQSQLIDVPYCHIIAFLITTDLLCLGSLNEHVNGCEPLWADFLLHQTYNSISSDCSALRSEWDRRGVRSVMGSTAPGQQGWVARRCKQGLGMSFFLRKVSRGSSSQEKYKSLLGVFFSFHGKCFPWW